METMTAAPHSAAPSRAPPTTRTVLHHPTAVDSSHHHHQTSHRISDNSTTTTTTTTTTSPSLSQDSYISGYSSHNESTPKLHSSHSNLSQLTTNTDLTEPDVSSQPSKIHRDRTPDNGQDTSAESVLASPMSIASPNIPTINGSKRTASGHVKSAASLSTPMYPPTSTRSRRESTASSVGSRAGELAASLKERLGYAMAKVQHGWEHKSLNEVEQLAASRERNNRASNRYSAGYMDARPQTSGLSSTTANMSINEGMYAEGGSITSPPAKRRSGHYNFSLPMSSSQPTYQRSTPRLDPAPDLSSVSHPTNHQRKSSNANNHAYTPSSAMSPPRTPVARERPTTLRTQTQTMEAERDAIMVLSQLGSPRKVQREDSGGSLVSAGR